MTRRGVDHSADLFVAAAIEPHRWPEALAGLAAATGSTYAQLIGFGPGLEQGFNWVNGDTDQVLRDAFAQVEPEHNFRVVASRRFPALPILDERHYDQVRPLLASSDYVQLADRHGIPFGCQTNLRDNADGLIGLALLRGRHEGPTGAAERATFDRARRKAAAAVTLQVALEQQGFRLLAGAFEAMNSACYVLDAGMRVRAMTPAAEQLLAQGALGLRDGLLRAPGRAQQIALGRLWRALGSHAATSRCLILTHEERPPLALQAHRLPRQDWSLGFAPAALVVVTGRGADFLDRRDALRSAFGLTATEAIIAAMLADGTSRAAIAAARAVSHETVRTHLRAIYAKLGVRREAEAAALLNRLIGQSPHPIG